MIRRLATFLLKKFLLGSSLIVKNNRLIFSAFKAIIFCLLVCFISACAQSKLSSSADSEAKAVFASGSELVHSSGGASPQRFWRGSSQATRGVLIGGVAGGVVGGMSSGLGVVPGLLGGAVFGGSLGSWVDANTNSLDELQNHDAKVLVLGDQIKIVLLSANIFNANSSTVNPHAYAALNSVVEVIQHYPNRRVKVSAFSGNLSPPEVNYPLTTAQAESVMRYLWKGGVNTRLIYAAGYNGDYPVAKPGGKHPRDNSRVEITLEKLPV